MIEKLIAIKIDVPKPEVENSNDNDSNKVVDNTDKKDAPGLLISTES